MPWFVNVVETNVLGAIAFHAACTHCPYQSKRVDGETGRKIAVRLAKKHGEYHAQRAARDASR